MVDAESTLRMSDDMLDEAERALVSASFSRASNAAAAARALARGPAERCAAECVWVQAEYKLGRLSTHAEDARRLRLATTAHLAEASAHSSPRSSFFSVEGASVSSFERQALLLWCRLRMAHDGGGTGDLTHAADAAAVTDDVETALLSIFSEAEERAANAAPAPSPSSSSSSYPGGGVDASPPNARVDDDDADAAEVEVILGATAWLYAVQVLCERRADADAAGAWLERTWRLIPPAARTYLTEEVAAARARTGTRRGDGDASGWPRGTPGESISSSLRRPAGARRAGRVSRERGPVHAARRMAGDSPGDDSPASKTGSVDSTAHAAEEAGSEPRTGRCPSAAARGGDAAASDGNGGDGGGGVAGAFYDAIAASVVTAGSSLGVDVDVGSPTVRGALAVGAVLGAVALYAAAAEAKQMRRWAWDRARTAWRFI